MPAAKDAQSRFSCAQLVNRELVKSKGPVLPNSAKDKNSPAGVRAYERVLGEYLKKPADIQRAASLRPDFGAFVEGILSIKPSESA